MALPSPISATTGRSGSASLAPIAAGRPQPMPPPRRPKKLCSSSLLISRADARRRGQHLLDHHGVLRQHRADRFEQRQRLHRRLAGQRAGLGAERVAVFLDRLGRATCSRAAAALLALAVMRAPTAAVMSGSVALGSPRIATCAG